MHDRGAYWNTAAKYSKELDARSDLKDTANRNIVISMHHNKNLKPTFKLHF